MKALITGGTGFVGSHIARQLFEAGHTIRVLHRQSSQLKALDGITFESAIGDVTNLDALRAASKGCDVVFHVAAVADYWRADESRMYEVNVEGTRNVLKAARDAGVKRVIFTSSVATIGMDPQGQPADESIRFNLPPESLPYAHSKSLAEDVVAEAVADGQDVVILNPAVITGPGDLNLISGTFVIQIKKLQWLTPYSMGGIGVIDVRDVARAHIQAVEKGRTGERYILSTANYTNREWMHLIAHVIGVKAPIMRTPDFLLEPIAQLAILLKKLGIELPIDAHQVRLARKRVFFDTTKMRTELGEPQISMAQSIADTYAWYAAHGYIQNGYLSNLIELLGKPF